MPVIRKYSIVFLLVASHGLISPVNCSSVYAGPISEEMTEDSFWKEFSEEVCELNWAKRKSWTKAKTKACDDKWKAAFLSRLSDFYTLADQPFVEIKCKAYPVECKKRPEKVEAWFEESHNRRLNEIESVRRSEESSRAEERERQERETEAQNLENLRKAANSLTCGVTRTCGK